MAYTQRSDFSLDGNELQNFVVQNLGGAPTAPKAGQPYFNTSVHTLMVFDGTTWRDALSQGDYTFTDGVEMISATRTVKIKLGTSTNVTLTAGAGGLSASVPDASTSTKGVIEIATDAEATTGTATNLAITPKQLATRVEKLSTKPTVGTYTKVTINAEGQVTSGTSLSSTDVTTALGFTPYNATNPSGYQANVIESIKVNGVAQTITAKSVDIAVPTTAADVDALPDTTKYGATFDLSLNTTDYKLTVTLKDQDGTALSTKTVDFPIESMVVNGSYDATNKKIILTLQNGTTIDIPVADLIAGLQTEITSTNKLDADLVDDTTAAHKFVSATEKSTWNGKQDAISDLATIRAGAALGATATQKITATNPALTATSGVVVWNITNTIGTKYVAVHVYETATGDEIGTEVSTSNSTVTITMNSESNIAAGDYFAVVIG